MKKLMKAFLSLTLCIGLMLCFGCELLGIVPKDYAATTIIDDEQSLTPDVLREEISAATESEGEIIQNFDNALDAFFYAKNHFEKTATDYATYLSGTARPNKGGVQTVYSERYKSSKTNNFYYATHNYGEQILGIDPTMSAKIYKENGNSFKAKIVKGKYNQGNKNGVQKDAGKLSADYTGVKYDIYNDSNPIVKGLGNDPTKLSVYIINKNTVKNVNGFQKLQDGSYEFNFDLNEGSAANYKTQVKAYSGYPYKDFKSVNIAFKIDKYGRFKKIVCKDCYSVAAKVLVSITIKIETKTAEDFYYNCAPGIQMVNGNPKVAL